MANVLHTHIQASMLVYSLLLEILEARKHEGAFYGIKMKNVITQKCHCTMGYNIHIPKEVQQLFPPSKIYVITGTLALFHWP